MSKKHTPIRKFLIIALLMVSMLGIGVGMVEAQESASGSSSPSAAPSAPTAPAAASAAPTAEPAASAPSAGDKKDPPVQPELEEKPAITSFGNATFGAVVGNNESVTVKFAELLALFLRLISQILFPLLMFAGGLMKSDFLYTGAIDLKLSEMWVQVRNLVNIAYVLLLLVVALYNVLGLGELVSVLELKKALPKIILGLILVNFSYAGVKVVLDVVNVGTTFAFAIGRSDADLTQKTAMQIAASQGEICREMGESRLASTIETDEKVIANCVKQSKESDPTKAESACRKNAKIASEGNTGMCRRDATGNYKLAPEVTKYLTNWNIDGSLMIIAIKFMNIQKLGLVAAEVQKGGITSLAVNMLFSVIMYLIYAVSFIVLTIVLFIRAAVLWMVIIFSPLLVLNTTFPNLIPGGAGGFAGKITKSLLAPIIIGFVLSIGYILLATMQNVNYEGLGGVPVGAPTSSIDTFQDLLVTIGAIVFIWLGIKAANDGTIAESVAGKVIENAQGAGTWLAKAPFLYTPFFQVSSPHSVHSSLEGKGRTTEELKVTDIPNLLGQLGDSERRKSNKRVQDFLGSEESEIKLKDMSTVADLSNNLKSFTVQQLRNEENIKDFNEGLENIYQKAANKNAVIGGTVTLEQLYRAGGAERTRLLDQARSALIAAPAATQAATTTGAMSHLNDIAQKFQNDNKSENTTRIENLATILIEQNSTTPGANAAEKGKNIAANLKNGITNWSDTKRGNLIRAIGADKLREELEKTLTTAEVASLLREVKAALSKL